MTGPDHVTRTHVSTRALFPGHLASATIRGPRPKSADEPSHTPPKRAVSSQPLTGVAAHLRALAAEPMGSASPNAWKMPRYRGRDIADHLDTVAALKRSGDLDAALDLALACMNAMATAARRNPANAMEHYVIEPCIILSKMKRTRDEIELIEAWLALGIPAPRADFRIRLEKRLAKAQQVQAKADGRDPAPYAARWHELAAAEQRLKASAAPPSTATGRSIVDPGARQRRSSSPFIPTPSDLASREFVAVDFETANRQGGVSACQIAMVRFRDGAPVDSLATFIRPPAGWDHFEFTWLHGISAADTRRAPMWDALAAPIAAFVADAPVFAHNASFDARVWRQLDEFFGTASLPAQFFCSLQMSRRMIPGLPDYKLPTVVEACAPGHRFTHHRADADALACGLIVAHLQRLAR